MFFAQVYLCMGAHSNTNDVSGLISLSISKCHLQILAINYASNAYIHGTVGNIVMFWLITKLRLAQ